MDLFDLCRSLELPIGDYAIFGSGPLIIRGVIEADNDLDLISRGAAWDRALEVGQLVRLAQYDVDIVSCFDGAITIGRSWAYGDFDIEELIDTAEMIEELPFVRLDAVVEFKQLAARPKDLRHLELLEEFKQRGADQ